MEIINQTVEYALSDLFMTWWYIIAITCTCAPVIVAGIHDLGINSFYKSTWIEKGTILYLLSAVFAVIILIIANFTCATPTGYYEYTAIFNDVDTQKEVFSMAKDIEYVDGVYKFKSMLDYGGLK